MTVMNGDAIWCQATGALFILVLVAGCQSAPDANPRGKHLSCNDIRRDVIRNSAHQARANARNWQISSIEQVTTATGRHDYECRGIARLTDGSSAVVLFGVTDTHGNQTPNYSFEAGEQSAAAEAFE